jgi:hypothetical protein
MELQCLIYQQSLCGKTFKFKHVVKVVESGMDFIRFNGLYHRQFFLGGEGGGGNDAEENANVFNHTDVRWPSHGTVLKLFSGALRLEI